MNLNDSDRQPEKEPVDDFQETHMQVKSRFKSILDFIRTAPYGEIMCLGGIAGTTLNAIAAQYEIINLQAAVLCSIGAAYGLRLIIKQHILRRRLEKVCRNGYSDRAFEGTLTMWCDRQTARVAAENTGHLNNYLEFCKNNKDKMWLSFIPHF